MNSQVSNDIVPEFEYISLPAVRAIPDVKFVAEITIELQSVKYNDPPLVSAYQLVKTQSEIWTAELPDMQKAPPAYPFPLTKFEELIVNVTPILTQINPPSVEVEVDEVGLEESQ